MSAESGSPGLVAPLLWVVSGRSWNRGQDGRGQWRDSNDAVEALVSWTEGL
ncbi:hypothetical protein [Streptomyces sp. SLBN-118]|uniref:hypothetical protein n=1 Tax=Streptomyces sp. SLBN-118 TaxID=2768454 RepID=UPI001357ABBC|nr:hypothetical protein [Streptomyces sp. SLBN-118]